MQRGHDPYAAARDRAVIHLLAAGRLLELDPRLEAQRSARWCFRWASRVDALGFANWSEATPAQVARLIAKAEQTIADTPPDVGRP